MIDNINSTVFSFKYHRFFINQLRSLDHTWRNTDTYTFYMKLGWTISSAIHDFFEDSSCSLQEIPVCFKCLKFDGHSFVYNGIWSIGQSEFDNETSGYCIWYLLLNRPYITLNWNTRLAQGLYSPMSMDVYNETQEILKGVLQTKLLYNRAWTVGESLFDKLAEFCSLQWNS